MEIGSVGSPTVKVLVAIALDHGHQRLHLVSAWIEQAQDIAAKTKVADQKNRELSDVKAKYLERQKTARQLQHRVDVIDQLRASQTGYPMNLLNTVGDTVSGTEEVWLSTMKDQGANISIEGMALSTDAVANLIANLQKTGYFKNIEIKETYQDEHGKGHAIVSVHADM